MQALQPLLQFEPVDRVRRNHGLEHATIHVLSGCKRRGLAGYSDTKGFWIMGNLDAEEIESGVNQALQRMRSGETDLAVHPGCGTNYVTSGMFGALAAFVAFFGAKTFSDKLARLPLAMALVTGALIFAQPVGLKLQAEITTDGHVRGLEVTSVKKVRDGVHRVETHG